MIVHALNSKRCIQFHIKQYDSDCSCVYVEPKAFHDVDYHSLNILNIINCTSFDDYEDGLDDHNGAHAYNQGVRS